MNPVVEVAMKAVPFVLVGLVLALFYGLQREKFNVVARGVFLALEKETQGLLGKIISGEGA